MLDLLLKLIDKLIELAKRREQQRADLFKNFIEPAWTDFEAVHQNYIDSLRHYSELISSPSETFNHKHSVFAAIELDSMSSDSMREKIRLAWRTFPKMSPRSSDNQLPMFLWSCIDYLEAGTDLETVSADIPGPPFINVPRIALRDALRRVAARRATDEERRQLANVCVKRCLNELQKSYSNALRRFNDARVALLRPTDAS